MVEGACDNSDLAMLNFFITHSPSPSFVGSSLPEGAFVFVSERRTEGQIKQFFQGIGEETLKACLLQREKVSITAHLCAI